MDDSTLMVALSVGVSCTVDTSPSPASALLAQLRKAIAKCSESYRARVLWAEYSTAKRRHEDKLKLLQHAVRLKGREQHAHDTTRACERGRERERVFSFPACSCERAGLTTACRV